MKPKIIIHINKGLVWAVHSNVEINYVVIDEDVNGVGLPYEVGQKTSPDSVDDKLEFPKAGMYSKFPKF